MTPEEEQAIAYHVRELAKLLYKDADTRQLPLMNLGEIEATVREQVQKHVTPEMGIFLSKPLPAPVQATSDDSKASWET